MNCLQVSSTRADGSGGTGSGFQADFSGQRAVASGRTGAAKPQHEAAGCDNMACEKSTWLQISPAGGKLTMGGIFLLVTGDSLEILFRSRSW